MTTREELRKEYEDKLAKLEREEAIRQYLPEIEGLKYSIHFFNLYGTSVSIHAKAVGYYNQLNLGQVYKVAESLSAIPLVRLKGTYTSFVAECCVDKYPYDYKELDKLAPWLLIGDKTADYAAEISLTWFTQLPDGVIAKVTVDLPYSYSLFGYTCRVQEHRGYITYEDCQLRIGNDLLKIFDSKNREVASHYQSSSYGNGDGTSRYAMRIIQTWIPSDSDLVPTVLDFVNACQNQQNRA